MFMCLEALTLPSSNIEISVLLNSSGKTGIYIYVFLAYEVLQKISFPKRALNGPTTLNKSQDISINVTGCRIL